MNSHTILRRKAFILAIILTISTVIYHRFFDKSYLRYQPLPEYKNIEVEILYCKEKDYGYLLTCDTEKGKALVYWYIEDRSIASEELIGLFTEIRLKDGLELPVGRRNPRCFDFRKNLLGKGIKYVGHYYGRGLKTLDRKGSPILGIKRWLITKREDFLKRNFPKEEDRALARGILFGETDDIDEEVYEAFQKNNTAWP